jgi:tRNA (mo5U34)-methyltransferase
VRGRDLSAELRAEVDGELNWMYPWDLGKEVELTYLNPEIPDVHRTRSEMIEGPVREALAAAGPQPSAIDLACSEGWFAHRLLDWGAARVVGIEIRERMLRRAELLRDHFGISPERLELRRGDLFSLDPRDLGAFDVVLLMGLVYHVENPVGALRIARALTRSLCAIESQLTRQEEPVRHGNGTTDSLISSEASFAAYVETDAHLNPVAAVKGVLSLVPNRAALDLMARVSGFSTVEFATPGQHHNQQYRRGDRSVLLARP